MGKIRKKKKIRYAINPIVNNLLNAHKMYMIEFYHAIANFFHSFSLFIWNLKHTQKKNEEEISLFFMRSQTKHNTHIYYMVMIYLKCDCVKCTFVSFLPA